MPNSLSTKGSLKSVAIDLLSIGINSLPCFEKVPSKGIKTWSEAHFSPITEETIDRWFALRHDQIAVACGEGSENVEAIDFDKKNYRPGQDVYSEYCELVTTDRPELFKRLVIEKSPGGGYHIYYRCEEIAGSQKLATWQNGTTPALGKDGKPTGKLNPVYMVPIETRGQGGYIVSFPSPGYILVQNTLFDIPVISIEERDFLLTAARSFDEMPAASPRSDKPKSEFKWPGASPFEDYDEKANVAELLESYGWTENPNVHSRNKNLIFFKRPGDTKAAQSANYDTEKKRLRVHTSATRFLRERELDDGTVIPVAYAPHAILSELQDDGDYKKTFHWLYHQGYGERNQTYESRYPKDFDWSAFHEKKKLGESEKYLANGHVSSTDTSIINEDDIFWFTLPPKKKGDEENKQIDIDRLKYRKFLNSKGFYQYRLGDNEDGEVIVYIHAENKIIKVVDIQYIKAFMTDYFEKLKHEDARLVLLKLMKAESVFFGSGQLGFLPMFKEKMLRDTEDTAWVFFSNMTLEVKSDKIIHHPFPYKETDGYIWKSQVINHQYSELENKGVSGKFYEFLKCVCTKGMGAGENLATKDDDGKFDSRLQFLKQVYGYLIHSYKNPTNAVAIIISDMKLAEDGDDVEMGGTGKGILAGSIKHIRKQLYIDGKTLEKTDNVFFYQRFTPEMKSIFVDDVNKDFDFPRFFNNITGDVIVEQKNKKSFPIPFEDVGKYIFTTNYAIKSSSDSTDRRKNEIELTDFFGKHRRPKDHLGLQLFTGFNPDEWNQYYNVCVMCLQEYLKNGMNQIETTSVDIKRLISKTSMDFYEFWKDIDKTIEQEKAPLYDLFIVEYGINPNKFDKRRFTAYMKAAFKSEKMEYKVRKSGNQRFYQFPEAKERPYSLNPPKEEIVQNILPVQEQDDDDDFDDTTEFDF